VGVRGLGLLDVVVTIALLALLIYALRLDWQRIPGPPTPPTPPASTATP
jgi:hypothetical protein